MSAIQRAIQGGTIQVAVVEDDARLRRTFVDVLESSTAFRVDCVAELSGRLPDTQILMVTVYQDPDTTFQALAAGAHGYLVKPVLPERLLEAIREIRAGGVPMSRTIARKVIETFRSREAAEAGGTSAARSSAASLDDESLTPREQQVLELLVEGFSYKEISQRLGISTSTVGTYVQRIYEKLHVSSRREIMARRRPGRE